MKLAIVNSDEDIGVGLGKTPSQAEKVVVKPLIEGLQRQEYKEEADYDAHEKVQSRHGG